MASGAEGAAGGNPETQLLSVSFCTLMIPAPGRRPLAGRLYCCRPKSTMDYNGGYFDREADRGIPAAGAGGPDRRAARPRCAVRCMPAAGCHMAQIVLEEEQGRGRYISGLLRRISPPGFSQTEGSAEEGVLPEAVGARMKPGVFPRTRTGPGEVRRPRMEGGPVMSDGYTDRFSLLHTPPDAAGEATCVRQQSCHPF